MLTPFIVSKHGPLRSLGLLRTRHTPSPLTYVWGMDALGFATLAIVDVQVHQFDGDSFGAVGDDYNAPTSGSSTPIPYVQLRGISAACGAAVPMLAYGIVQALGFSSRASMLAGMLLVFDTALVTQCRCIMLDGTLHEARRFRVRELMASFLSRG